MYTRNCVSFIWNFTQCIWRRHQPHDFKQFFRFSFWIFRSLCWCSWIGYCVYEKQRELSFNKRKHEYDREQIFEHEVNVLKERIEQTQG